MKRKKSKQPRANENREPLPGKFKDVKQMKMSRKAKLIFDLKAEFINIPNRDVFLELAELSTKYILEFNMMLWKVFHDPQNKMTPYTLHFARIKPSKTKELRRLIRRKNIVGDILERQCMRGLREELKGRKLNLTEDWFETSDVVYPDEYMKFGPEKLRATMITALLRNGAPIQDVARQVGHRLLSTTARYAPPLTQAQIRKNYLKAHPKA